MSNKSSKSNDKFNDNKESLTCLKCNSKTFEIYETKTGNISITCTSCGGSISPLHPMMSIEEFLQMWIIALKNKK